MLLVILGAGASYDAVPTIPASQSPHHDLRLPLANDLFDPKYHKYLDHFQQCLPIIPYLQNTKSGITIEKVLQELQSQSDSHADRATQLAAVRFYLQHLISQFDWQWAQAGKGVLNVLTMFDQIRHSVGRDAVVPFVTFNYDRIIETVLRRYGRNFSTIPAFIEDANYPVFKLHGSVDWARKIETSIQFKDGDWTLLLRQLIDEASHIKVTGPFLLMDDLNIPELPKRFLYPAIAIPLESKQDFECPLEHIEKLTDLLPKVDSVIIVGWRAADKPFVKLLAEKVRSRTWFLVIAGSPQDAKETIDNLKKFNLNWQYDSDGAGFTNAARGRRFEYFLKQHLPPP